MLSNSIVEKRQRFHRLTMQVPSPNWGASVRQHLLEELSLCPYRYRHGAALHRYPTLGQWCCAALVVPPSVAAHPRTAAS